MKTRIRNSLVGVAALAAALGLAGRSMARGMVPTAGAAAAGYHLSTFADGFTVGGQIGPIGIAKLPDGSVMVSSYTDGVNAVFALDVDGQHYANSARSNFNSLSHPSGIAVLNGHIYQAEQGGAGTIAELDAHGNFVQAIVTGLRGVTGLIVNPTNGHLYASLPGFDQGGIYDVDPIARTAHLLTTTLVDGIAVNGDGSILYAADTVHDHMIGYDTSNFSHIVFDSGPIAGDIDGSVLGYGSLAGNLFVNINDGHLIEINLTTLAQTVIGQGGSRGDFVVADSDGSLLLTQSDSVLRLIAPGGGSFGNSAAPEPATVVSAAIGLMTVAGYRLRRRKTSTLASTCAPTTDRAS